MDTARQPALPGRHPVAGAALVLGAACLWATFGLFAKHLYDAGFAPLELASVRAAVGFIGFAVFLSPRLLRNRTSLLHARTDDGDGTDRDGRAGDGSAAGRRWRTLLFLAAYGILGYALFTLVFFAALERTTVSVAVALLYTAPAFVLVMSAVLWRERIGAARLLSLVLVLAGVVLVTGTVSALVQGTAALAPAAVVVGVSAGLTYAIYTMFSKVATERYGPAVSLVGSFLFATLALGVLAPPHVPFLRQPEHVPALVALGVVPTLIPYALYLRGLRELRASTAAMLASVEPVVATLLAAALLHERLDALQLVGMALVVTAAVLLTRQAR